MKPTRPPRDGTAPSRPPRSSGPTSTGGPTKKRGPFKPTPKSAENFPAGFEARQAAVETLWRVMKRGTFFEEAFAEAFQKPERAKIEPRDRAFARLLVTTVLRRHGELTHVINTHLQKPLPEPQGWVWQILLAGAAQLLVLDTPPHAAIGLAVDQCKADPNARRFDKLVNAVLRRVSDNGRAALADLDAVALNVPPWLLAGWEKTYGPDLARRIAASSLEEPPLDVTVKGDAAEWAAKLQGVALPTGTVRILQAGRIPDLPGFDDGFWWVQDAAAALPVHLLNAKPGQRVADLCAAPGGKTAELVNAGAHVTAVDISAARLRRVKDNLDRLHFTADCVTADVLTWAPAAPFDAVLLDAPCSATGTIRRHPDILHVRQTRGFEKLTGLQGQLLERAATFVRPGGILVYCSCSLEPEEGEHQIARFLATHANFERVPVTAAEIGGLSDAITSDGDLRTLPSHRFPGHESGSGLDGFFASRLRRRDT
ncbi:MAG: MFS transporter [Hyphomicrobium sp. 32-62-53]|nr:MAG: MFS transporter [Hyphomicrobium sp. 12-62-95]OYY01045.1 MAG: MFS transporter [Hyphomicrobium sp. 32-62-53]